VSKARRYCPLDPHSTPAAWEKNRRVEFKVVKTEEGMTGVEPRCEIARSKGVDAAARAMRSPASSITNT